MLDLYDSLDRHKAGSKAKIANVEGNKEMFRGTESVPSQREDPCANQVVNSLSGKPCRLTEGC